MVDVLQITRLVCKKTEEEYASHEVYTPQYTLGKEPRLTGRDTRDRETASIARDSLVKVLRFTSQTALEFQDAVPTMEGIKNILGDSGVLFSPPEICIVPIAIKKTSGSLFPLTVIPAGLPVGMKYKSGMSSNAVADWRDMAEGAVHSVRSQRVHSGRERRERPCANGGGT